eukprot:CAMPEP_0114340674 /NCGR_PEP_ID=MMETSP0101-20121206/8532_1 /TAXON_ID=38822 ORGANISM="Pteridomonas danica, Strain PT" /NCGR_SAMPLE_ID=MMETSP0101 /ASSEMBLY_ACC=CAM_ASM_000211 /LENGTH=405 /DNA_ID=CAMNT_0001474011 /DNA_START=190 /DNA_END=1407 /DNA_ORIENTATION=-
MICVDNSEYMRNGDFSPSRMESIQDAANLISNAKMQSNPENTVGIMSLAGRNPELLVSPTDDMGKIMTSIHELSVKGEISFADGVQVAYLALKHRRNKHGGQRVVLFVGSPVTDDTKVLKKVAGNLKKNNIAVDVICLGEVDENREKLELFVSTVDKDRNSNLVTIPTGCTPSDVLVASPVISEGAGMGMPTGGFGDDGPIPASAGGPAPGGGGMDDFGGVDPNMDPELAMALRVSMEEERARQEQEATPAPAPAPTEPLESVPEALETVIEPLQPQMDIEEPVASSDTMNADDDDLDDDELLAQALALSMNDDTPATPEPEPLSTMEVDQTPPTSAPAPASESSSTSSTATTAPAAEPPAVYDSSFVNNLLASLPGVDPSDPRIQMALQQIQAKQDEADKDKEK